MPRIIFLMRAELDVIKDADFIVECCKHGHRTISIPAENNEELKEQIKSAKLQL